MAKGFLGELKESAKVSYDLLDGWYYDKLDSLDGKGLPVYKIVDPIDKHVPSLVILIALVVLLFLGGAVWVASSMLGVGGPSIFLGPVEISVTTLADGQLLQGVQLEVLDGDNLIAEEKSDDNGKASFELAGGMIATIKATAEHCDDKEVEVRADEDKEISIHMDCLTANIFSSCLSLPEEFDSARLVADDNAEPSNCWVTASTPEGEVVSLGWDVDADNRLWFSQDKCLQNDYEIYMDCDAHDRQGTAEELIVEAMQSGDVVVYSKHRVKYDLDAGKLFTVKVKVENSQGDALQGILITVTDSVGNEMITGYSNAKTTATTNYIGEAFLVVPEGIDYYIHGEDVGWEYAPVTSEKIISDGGKDILLTMALAELTKVVVKEEKGPIAGAPVLIKKGVTIFASGSADRQGVYTAGLELGSYRAGSAPKGYYPSSKVVEAGGTVELLLKKASADELGTIRIKAVDPDGKPVRDVRIQLNYGEATALECITRDSGKCVFSEAVPGTYTVFAIPPAQSNQQEFGEIRLDPGGETDKEIVISPRQFRLTVIANDVEGVLDDVDITLYSRMGDVVDRGKTDKRGEVEFPIYYGQQIYLRGEHRDYSDVESELVYIKENTDYTMFFSSGEEIVGDDEYSEGDLAGNWQAVATGERVVLLTPREIPRGGIGRMVLRTIGVKNREYESTTIEVWAGKPGTKNNPAATPIQLGEMEARAGSIVKSSDEYMEGREPSPKSEPSSTSKYIRYIVNSGGNQRMATGLYAVLEAVAKEGELHYRAIWRTSEGQEIISDWFDKEILITEEEKMGYDYDLFGVDQEEEMDTPVDSVVGRVTPLAEVCPPEDYDGKCQYGTFRYGSVLGSMTSEAPRQIEVVIKLKNTGGEGARIDIIVEAGGIDRLSHPEEIFVPAGATKEFKITGRGVSPGIIKVYLDGTKWISIQHGITEYSIDTYGTTVSEPLTTESSAITVKPMRNGQLMPNAKVYVLGKSLGLAETHFTSSGLFNSFDYKEIRVVIQHPEFGSIAKTFKVKGIMFRPTESDYKIPALLLNDYNPEIEKKLVTIQNNHDVPALVMLNEKFGDSHMHTDFLVTVQDKDGKEVLGTAIPAGGKAEVLFKASGDVSCNGEEASSNVTVTASAPGITKSAVYYVDTECSFERGIATGDWNLFRESEEIGIHSCAVIDNTAYLCDAQQLSAAILRSAEHMNEHGLAGERRQFAFGNDYVNAKVADTVRELFGMNYPTAVSDSAGGENVLQLSEITCGVVEVILTENEGVVKADTYVTEAPWCDPQSPYFFIGAMNFDKSIVDIVPEYVKTMGSVKGTMRFMDEFLPVDNEADYRVVVGDLTKTELKTLPVDSYGWLVDKQQLIDEGTGYYKVVGDSVGAELFVGVVDGNDGCFLNNMEHYWQTGKNQYIAGSVIGDVVLAELDRCEEPPKVLVPLVYKIFLLNSNGDEVSTTTENSIRFEVDSPVDGCKVKVEDASGILQGTYAKEGIFSIPSGLEYILFKASCRMPDGAWSKWVTAELIKDETPPSIELPDFQPTNENELRFQFVANDLYGVENCSLDFDPIGGQSGLVDYPPVDCYEITDAWECDSLGVTDFGADLPDNKYSLLDFEVSCEDTNNNIGKKEADIYYYPEGAPEIEMTDIDAVLVGNTYYTSNNPLDLRFTVKSKVGITGCVVDYQGVKECQLLDCNTQGGGNSCTEGEYSCTQVDFGTEQGAHDGVNVLCTEYSAAGEEEQKTSKPFGFVWDADEPVIEILATSTYDVTDCTPDLSPDITVRVTDTWWDDTNCEARIVGETNFSLAPGITATADSNADVTKIMFTSPKKAIQMLGVKGVKPLGISTEPNVVVECTTNLYNEQKWGMIDINLVGKVSNAEYTKIIDSNWLPDVPVYLLPPNRDEAILKLEQLGEYCYNKAYDVAGRNDEQTCYSVSFELLDSAIQGSWLSPSLADKGGSLVERGPMIGDIPNCGEDCMFETGYAAGSEWVVWFNDSGWKESDYDNAENYRHRNNLHIGSIASAPTVKWAQYQYGVFNEASCDGGEWVPDDTDPDADDWLLPTVTSMTADPVDIYRTCETTGAVPRGDVITTITCEGTDAESDELNYWAYFYPTIVNPFIEPDGAGEYPSTEATKRTEMDSQYEFAISQLGKFIFGTDDTTGLVDAGDYPVYCMATDQDWKESSNTGAVTINIHNSEPYVKFIGITDPLSGDSLLLLDWGKTAKIEYKIWDCEDDPTSLAITIEVSKDGGSTWSSVTPLEYNTPQIAGDWKFWVDFTADYPDPDDTDPSEHMGTWLFKATATDRNGGTNTTIGGELIVVRPDPAPGDPEPGWGTIDIVVTEP